MTRILSIKISIPVAIFAMALLLSAGTAHAAGPAPVNLLSAGNFVILAETAITTTGVTSIVGDIGISPNGASSLTGFGQTLDGSGTFSTSPQVIGKIYASNYTPPTPINMGIAIGDMVTAYNTAAGVSGPDGTELFAGNLGGQTLAPGLYKWSTNVIIPTNLTLSGGANDVWIFQIAGDLSIASGGSVPSGIKVVLTGGAQASNVFWQVGGPTGATLGTFSTFEGTILSAKQVVMQNGAVLNGRALAQTQVTLIGNTIFRTPISVPTSCNNPVTQTILSDTSNMIGGGFAVAVVPNLGWTATIPGSTTWIWQASSTVPNATVAFEKTFTVSGTVLSAQLDIASDNSYKVFIDGFQVAADANATNFTLATQDVYNLTANVTPGTHTLRIEVNNVGIFNASGNPAGLLYKFANVTCPPPPPPTGDVTVTIIKYVGGAHATSANAATSSFPMVSSWDDTNNGGIGNGTYALSPVGFNTANPYEAVTSNMANGSDYTTNEDTSTPVVGPSCASGQQFRLVGYTTGSSLAIAQASTPTATVPDFTNFTTSKWVIVWNEPCSTIPPPPQPCASVTPSGSIVITVCNRGSISNSTTANSYSGGNSAGGSVGGRGGRGGDVVSGTGGSENNGGALGGNGGNGGSGGAGGLVNTGDASADAGTSNDLNNTDAGVDLGDCACGDINSLTLDVIINNDNIENNRTAPVQNHILNDTRARARTGDNTALGSTGGAAGNGGVVNGGGGSENNGGAHAGTGGAGGAGGLGGTIGTGNASSTSGTFNSLNVSRIRITI